MFLFTVFIPERRVDTFVGKELTETVLYGYNADFSTFPGAEVTLGKMSEPAIAAQKARFQEAYLKSLGRLPAKVTTKLN